jgi:hypothetical protein
MFFGVFLALLYFAIAPIIPVNNGISQTSQTNKLNL